MDGEKVRRSENAFVQQIFDKDTGKGLVCHLHNEKDGTSWQTFSPDWWGNKRITYDEVMDQTVACLKKEKEEALEAIAFLDSGTAVIEKASRMEVLTCEARKIFEEMAAIEEPDLKLYGKSKAGELSDEEYQLRHQDIMMQLSVKNTAFTECMKKADALDLLYSRKNPWIKQYSRLDVPDTLSKEQVKKWIGRVLVKDLESVEILLPAAYREWKIEVPDGWQEE